MTLKFDGWPRKIIRHVFYTTSSFCIISYPSVNSNWSNSPETPNLGQIRRFLELCDLKIWRMILKNNRAPLQSYLKFCASFCSHRWFKTGDTVRKRPIWVKIDDFQSRVTLQFHIWPWKTIGHLSMLLQALCIISKPLANSNWSYSQETANLGQYRRFFSRVTLNFDVWPIKTIGHLYYSTSSFVHHSVAIGEFELELQSRNAQFGSNSTIFRAVWPCNLTDDLEN